MSGTWVSPGEYAKAQGISVNTVKSRVRLGTVERRKIGPGRYEYLLPEEPEPEEEWEVNEGPSAAYVLVGDRYVFNLPSKPKHPFAVESNDIKRLVEAYSRDGDNASLNQCARMLGWHRRTVQEVLKALGKTHDSLPFTDESIADADESELVESLVRRKEERVHIKAERIAWDKTKQAADKWRVFERAAGEFFATFEVPESKRWFRKSKAKAAKLSAVSHATDLHYGKLGPDYNRKIAAARLKSANARLCDYTLRFGKPERKYLIVGGDASHVDNPKHTTTRGTPQDVDGQWIDQIHGLSELYVGQIEHWRECAGEVHVVAALGNHGYWTDKILMHWLRAYYRNASDVHVSTTARDREYRQIGVTALCVTHGDAMKTADIMAIMPHEIREWWPNVKWGLVMQGHWHTQIQNEKHGVLAEHNASLAGSDAWHIKHGYIGNRKAINGHVIDHELGPIAKLTADPDRE